MVVTPEQGSQVEPPVPVPVEMAEKVAPPAERLTAAAVRPKDVADMVAVPLEVVTEVEVAVVQEEDAAKTTMIMGGVDPLKKTIAPATLFYSPSAFPHTRYNHPPESEKIEAAVPSW